MSKRENDDKELPILTDVVELRAAAGATGAHEQVQQRNQRTRGRYGPCQQQRPGRSSGPLPFR